MDNNNRVPLFAGTYSAAGDSDIGQTVTFSGKLSGARNPSSEILDLSARYVFPIGERYELGLVVEVFNALDETTFASIGGTRQGVGNFLLPNSSLSPREYQLGVRLDF